jgi:cellulose synthase/poly-beta-1,6-N-acetylglucosamine synthase-like glycosyltransferase
MEPQSLLDGLFLATQIAYFLGLCVMVYFVSRPTNWVDMTLTDCVPVDRYPTIVLLYPVLRESYETMRTTLVGLAKLDYPEDRVRIVAVPNGDDTSTLQSLARLRDEFTFLEVMVVPSTSDPTWNVVWRAWDANPRAYWWHVGKGGTRRHHPYRIRRRDLPPKKTRQLVYAFYNLIPEMGIKGWLLDYIDADSVPPQDHLLAAVAGMQSYDVLQSTNVAGNLLRSWGASWHSFDHMSWDGLIYPHMSANGEHPYWVLGKGLFFRAEDLLEFGGFNPWLTIEDPEIGMRLWRHGKRLGIIAAPLIEEVPTSILDGITQRKRWVAGFFQSLGKPLRQMGMPFHDRLKARLNVLPCLSLLVNPIGLPIGIVVGWEVISGSIMLAAPVYWLGVANALLFLAVLAYVYGNTWKRTGMVLDRHRDRLRYMFRINPLFLWVYWLIWCIPILIGFQMFLRNRGEAWERTKKIDANHDLVRLKYASSVVFAEEDLVVTRIGMHEARQPSVNMTT